MYSLAYNYKPYPLQPIKSFAFASLSNFPHATLGSAEGQKGLPSPKWGSWWEFWLLSLQADERSRRFVPENLFRCTWWAKATCVLQEASSECRLFSNREKSVKTNHCEVYFELEIVSDLKKQQKKKHGCLRTKSCSTWKMCERFETGRKEKENSGDLTSALSH